MHEMLPKLFIIVPCYNEEEVLPVTAPLFLEKIQDLQNKGKISAGSRGDYREAGERE